MAEAVGLASGLLTLTVFAFERKSSHTSESIESFKDLVQTASDDLQAHLDGINEKLEMVLKRAVPETAADSDEPRRMKEERLSTQRCLQICDQSSEHISQIPIPSRPPAGTVDPDTTPESLINDELQECQANLTAAAAKFEIHMKELTERLVARSRAGTATQDDADDLTRLHDEWETTRQCLSICSKVDGHLKANVSIIENYATGDAVQFMVSTNGKVLHGKNHGLGQRTRQFGGYMSEKLVAQLSKDMANTGLHDPERDASARRAKSRDDTEDADETDPVADAWQRHGRGIRLANKHAPGLPRPAATMQTCQASAGALRAVRLSPSLRTPVQRRNLQDISITRTGKPIIRVPGGRSSLGGHTATVFGATGFLGRYIVNRLARRGCNVVVPYREEMAKRHLKPTGDLGRVSFIEFDLRNTASIEESVRHSDIVVNLIGRTYPTKNFSLWDVHVEGTERIAEAVAKYDCDRFIQAEGERVARALFPETTIVRPARLFGFEDQLLHRLAGGTNILTVNHLQERFWPVHVIDVGKALEQIAFDDTTAGETFELYGPTNYSMAEIGALVDREIIHERRHINIPKHILKPIAYWVNRLLWWPIISADELEVECLDQHIDKSAKTLADLGIEPADLADLTYHYLQDYRSSSFYDLPPATERERREDKKYLHVIDDQ
ncbi:hypothetical protein DV738_g5334, partial [Chaetothyriales sp. CBS 135597]